MTPIYNMNNPEELAKYLLSLPSIGKEKGISPRRSWSRHFAKQRSPEFMEEVKQHMQKALEKP